MKSKKEKPLSKKAKTVAFAGGIVIAWAVVTVSTAAIQNDASSDFAAADFSAISLSAAISAGEQRLADHDASDAVIFSKQALRQSVISAKALRIFGLAEQELGHRSSSLAIFSQASALGWRDVPTQLWLVQSLMASGNAAGAAQHLDAALRLDPTSPQLHLILDQIVLSDMLVPEIAKRMIQHPNWREPYLSDNNGTSTIARLRLAQELSLLHKPLTRDETLALVFQLIHDNQFAESRDVWFRTQGHAPALLYDPEFRQTKAATAAAPFEWSLTTIFGSDIQQRNENGNFGIAVSTDGSSSGVIARQMIVLTRGLHSLAVMGSVPPAAHQTLSWSVRCLPKFTVILDLSDASGLSHPFTVPESCSAQFIELHVRNALEPTHIKAAYDRLSLN